MPRGERPLDPGRGVVVEFARDLRRLRERAGRPTYRELSGRAHFSTSALSDAAAGRKLPSLAVTVAFVAACDGDIAAWESRWRDSAAELAGPALGAEDDPDAPYAGLAPFRRGDADRFFGRDRVVDDLVARVRGHRMVAVFGASGCGKSSVLMAGLLPRWLPDKESGRAVVLTPGPHPLEECAVRLAAMAGRSAADMRAELAKDPANLHLCVRQLLAGGPEDEDFLLVVDQFEELFTVCADSAERAAFVAALTFAVTTPTSRTRVVLGVRADFYGRCGEYPELVDALRDGQVLVGAMTSDELRQAVTGPAEAVGCRVETALVSRLVADATGQPAALPLVSHALRETWRRRQGTALTLHAYEAAGGIHHALARTADAVYSGLDAEQQRLAHQVFLRLTALGDGTDDTKRRVRRDEVGDRPATAAVLEKLAVARLIAVDQDGIEITHEALIRHWPRLRRWLDDDRDALRTQRQLTEATQVWEAHDRDRGSLLRGTRLTTAENLTVSGRATLTDREAEFVRTSVAARTHEQLTGRRRIRRTRRLVALLAVLLLVACVSLVSAVRAQNAATDQRNAVVVSGALRDADLARDANPALSLQLTLAAYRADPSPRARDALLGSLATPYASRIEGSETPTPAILVGEDGKLLLSFGWKAARLWDISDPHRPRRLPSSLPASRAAVFGPGHTLILATLNTNEVWDLRDPLRPHQVASFGARSGNSTEPVSAVIAYRGDGRTVATTDRTGRIQLWDLADIARPRPLAQITTGATSPSPVSGPALTFGGGGALLAVTSVTGHSIQLWDLADPARPRRLTTMSGDVATFAPDGRTLAVAGARGSVQLWDLTDPARPRTLATVTNPVGVASMAFDPGMRLLATGDVEGTVRLWDVADPRRPAPLTELTGHADVVRATVFAGGGVLVTADTDAEIRVWDLGSTVVHHDDALTVATVDHRGDLLATAGRDHTARLWRITGDSSRQLATLDTAFTPQSASFSPDDRTLVLAGYEGRTEVWHIADRDRPVRATTLPAVNSLAAMSFAQNAKLVVSQADRHTRLYDLADPDRPRAADELAPYALDAVALDPSGTLLAATFGGYTNIWDVDAPFASQNLTVATAIAGSAAGFRSDGRVLAVVNVDGVQLWSVRDPHEPELLSTIRTGLVEFFPFEGPPPVFSEDGRTIATADGGGAVSVWNVADPRRPKEIESFDFGRQVDSVSLTPDGRHVYAAAEGNVVQHRYVDVEDIAAKICAIAYPRITTAEWRRYFPDLSYHPPCRLPDN